MGEVYRARDLKLRREVAIKVLPAAVSNDPERLQRLEREACLLASLNHPLIGAIYGVEEHAGVYGLVLELVEGQTLAERLAAGPLPVAETLALARQIIDALDAAHERGIIHRDLKPGNVKVTPEGIVKVLDFGLAKAVVDEAPAAELTHSPTITIEGTRSGTILGTAAYMSPEQARGKTVDKRTDIWAFGCVLYELVIGRRAFHGETTSDMIAAILGREPVIGATPSATLLPQRAKAPWQAGALLSIGLILISVAFLAWRIGFQRTAQTPEWSTAQAVATQLTNYGGTEASGAISPNGRSFVFVSDHGGTPDIWLRQVSGGEPVRLTNDADEEANLVYAPEASRSISHVSDKAGLPSGALALSEGRLERS
jgi:serine/threonine protein kinase